MFKKNDVEDIYPLTPMQAGLLYHYQENRRSSAYFLQATVSVRGNLDENLYEKALNLMIADYDVLRSIFLYEGVKRPVQVVLKHRATRIHRLDISHLSREQQKSFLEDHRRRDRETNFNLDRDVLLRVSVIKTHEHQYEITWSTHHIIMDGWCLGLLFARFGVVYGALSAGEPVRSRPAAPFGRYVKWLAGCDMKRGREFWKNYLDGFQTPTPLPPPPETNTDAKGVYNPSVHEFTVGEETDRDLERTAARYDTTPSSLLQAAWGILLQRYNYVNDAVFGAVVSGRPPQIDGIDDMVGLFINTLPVRVTSTGPGEPFSRLLKRHHRTLTQCRDHEYVSLPDIQADSTPGNDLVRHIMVFENYPLDEMTGKTGKSGTTFSVENVRFHEQTHYDFNIIILPGDPLRVKFYFNRTLYPQWYIERAARHFRRILDQVTENPEIRTGDIELVSGDETRDEIRELSRDGVTPPAPGLEELWRGHVERVPHGIALADGVAGGGPWLSRGELDRRADQLAGRLKTRGIGPDGIAALMVGAPVETVETITGILGILKAGGAYLPLDPALPRARINHMLGDSGATLRVTPLRGGQWRLEDLMQNPSFPGHPVYYDYVHRGYVHRGDSLAYVMYTSGTTGRPRGVVVGRGNVVGVVNNTNYIQITPRDRLLELSNFIFDGSVFDIFGALLNGAPLIAADRGNLGALPDTIRRQCITVFFATTALFNTLVDMTKRGTGHTDHTNHIFSGVRKVLFGGERVSVPHVARALAHPGGCDRLLHMYGPTETTVFATCHRVVVGDADGDTVPIGVPITGVMIHILDRCLQPVPIGITGEIHIGGTGVARGYLNQPELTAKKFLPGPSRTGFIVEACPNAGPGRASPWPPEGRRRLYKTGDLGRWQRGGAVEFVGRIDQQVKIRGFRVELGEIERYLSLVPGVGSVVVQPWEKCGDRGLCAYVTVAADAVAPKPGELKDYLAQWLPAYMIPTDFIRLEHIPLTPNGKVDRRALPSPSPVPRLHQSPVPRLHKTLNKFVQLWSEILGSPVGPDDDFFRLGGHSLKAALLAVRLQQEFNLRVSPADIFRYPTVRQLAAARGGTKFSGTDDIRSTEDKEYYPLSYQQQQLLDQGHRHPGSSADHVFGRITLPYPADRPTIVAVLEQLIIRHTLFRAYFGEIAGSPVQFIQDTGQVKELTRRAMQKTEHITEPITGPDSGHALCRREVRRSFDLSRAPLLRVVPVTTRVTPTGGVSNHNPIHELIFTLHHIICDGWSMDILKRDFLALYEGQHREEAVELGSPSLEYRDFAAWQNQALENPGVREKALSYWRRQLEGGFAPPPLPVLPVPPTDDVIYRGMVGKEIREKLQKVAAEHGTTLFMVMYAAFQLLLGRVYGVHDVVCRFADAGRPFAPFHSVVGCFRVPILTKIPVKKNEAFGRLLRRTAALTAEAIENQYYPYERVFHDLSLPVPEPTVGFNMLNMWQEETPTPSPVPQFPQFSPVPQLTQLAEPVTDVKFPLYLQLIPLPQGIETTWMAVKRHFTDGTLRDLAHRYLEALPVP